MSDLSAILPFSTTMLIKLSIVILMTRGTFCSGADSKCSYFQLDSVKLDKQLVGHAIANLTVTGHHDCAKECMVVPLCKSIDYNKLNKSCKLNDIDSMSAGATEFIVLQGAAFSDISTWSPEMAGLCGSNPCTAQQRCIQILDTIQCIDISCEERLVGNGNVKLEAPGKNKFLDTANVLCRPGFTPSQPTVRCLANGSWEQATCIPEAIYTDCSDILRDDPAAISGWYLISLWQSNTLIDVNCDMATDGGGWTHFQFRLDGTLDFFRDQLEYEDGFFSSTEEWLGLNIIQEIASQGRTELRVEVTKKLGQRVFEQFLDFKLEGPTFILRLGDRSGGDAGYVPQGLSFNNGSAFSTRNNDNAWNCANKHKAGFWFASSADCTWVSLNGVYCGAGTLCNDAIGGATSAFFYTFSGYYSLETTTMMMRRV